MVSQTSLQIPMDLESQAKKRKRKQNPESEFRFALDTCSKKKDLLQALSLYENSKSQGLKLTHHHFNTLLYLCSNFATDPSIPIQHPLKQSAFGNGSLIFHDMLASNVQPTEATITNMARLAAAKEDGDFAFELVKTMENYKITPRLRSYGPALFAFCRNMEAEKAYGVEEHMGQNGVVPEEQQVAALLKVSAVVGREEKVYLYLQRLRNCTGCVLESTGEIIESWFRSELASDAGRVNWDVDQVKEAILRNGGGWHGQGWLGKGKWRVCKSNISYEGTCCCCRERLDCIDIDDQEAEKFEESIASLAMEREVKSNFKDFEEWLDKHGACEAIVDGANVALYQQNFVEGAFSLSQLDRVVKELYKRSLQKKWPLVILHNKRARKLMGNTSSRKILDEWRVRDALYTTPNGSNDDWYWLYAAVKSKCLLVTNDEMRDHIFELLGRSFFLKWKERHQVRFTFAKCDLKIYMPPPYSSVIQESERGSWHVPLQGECHDETSRSWICITRYNFPDISVENLVTRDNAQETDEVFATSQTSVNSKMVETARAEKGLEPFS